MSAEDRVFALWLVVSAILMVIVSALPVAR